MLIPKEAVIFVREEEAIPVVDESLEGEKFRFSG
jgi:hypothetical protein